MLWTGGVLWPVIHFPEHKLKGKPWRKMNATNSEQGKGTVASLLTLTKLLSEWVLKKMEEIKQ